jgi:hypothetical protein
MDRPLAAEPRPRQPDRRSTSSRNQSCPSLGGRQIRFRRSPGRCLFLPQDWPTGLEPKNNDSMVLHVSYVRDLRLARRRRRKSRRVPRRQLLPSSRGPAKGWSPRQRNIHDSRNFASCEADLCRDLSWPENIFRPAQTQGSRAPASLGRPRLPHRHKRRVTLYSIAVSTLRIVNNFGFDRRTLG